MKAILPLLLVALACQPTGDADDRAPGDDPKPQVERTTIVTWIEAGELGASPAPEKSPGGVEGWLLELAESTALPVAVLNLRGTADPVFGEPVVETRHIPVVDFQPPTLEQAQQAITFIEAQRAMNRAVIVHCHGGCGRTGTILALYLRKRDSLTGSQAVKFLRSHRACFVETQGQQDFVDSFEFSALP